jgi:hypothetical protein
MSLVERELLSKHLNYGEFVYFTFVLLELSILRYLHLLLCLLEGSIHEPRQQSLR